MASQWERLLKNQGTWVGSFTQISPTGEIIQDTPTEVVLQPFDQDNAMRQEIRRQPPGQPVDETILEYRSLGRGVLFGETGAFSQGSMQWSPVSEFGAELGLIHGSERLRLALVYQRQPSLGRLTLIREHRAGTTPTPRPTFSIEPLIGTWEGQATTVFPDFQPEQRMETRLVIQSLGADQVEQTLTFGSAPPIRSQGRRVDSAWRFEAGSSPVTVLPLPSGASATFPSQIQPGQPLFLEVGWLVNPSLRQRLIRTYNGQGTWVSLTLVEEQRLRP